MQDQVEVMKPLYPPEGGKCLGFSCNEIKVRNRTMAPVTCGAVTKTKRGMWAHLRMVHGVEKQPKLKFEEPAA